MFLCCQHKYSFSQDFFLYLYIQRNQIDSMLISALEFKDSSLVDFKVVSLPLRHASNISEVDPNTHLHVDINRKNSDKSNLDIRRFDNRKYFDKSNS